MECLLVVLCLFGEYLAYLLYLRVMWLLISGAIDIREFRDEVELENIIANFYIVEKTFANLNATPAQKVMHNNCFSRR